MTGILLSFFLTLLRYLPLPVAHLLSRFSVSILDRTLPRLRRTARENLAFALPEHSPDEIIGGVFRSIARLLVSFARLPDITSSNVDRWIRVEGLENYSVAKERGRGVLIATGHIGNWELSAYAHALLTERMNIVVRPLDDASVDHIVEERRQLSGNRIIRKHQAARNILRALANNEAVGVLIDQNSSLQEGIFVPFFGKPACSGTAFARFANHSGATVIPGYAVWSAEERKYVLHLEQEVRMTGDDATDTAAIHKRLEDIVRRYPDQWLWIHRRWKTRMPG